MAFLNSASASPVNMIGASVACVPVIVNLHSDTYEKCLFNTFHLVRVKRANIFAKPAFVDYSHLFEKNTRVVLQAVTAISEVNVSR
ncbi:MAG: hypothetical protein FWH20_04805 [Oscillospiraceae bacterium]|nr:hypothetical protein [Oscillospiraceae bacterium]